MYLTLCLALVFLSGFTGLVYQVTWQRYLAYHLGSNALATTLVLAVFFLFLSLGYFAIGRSAHRYVRNKLFLYGILEGGIGLYCLVSPAFFHGLLSVFSFHVESPALELGLDLLFTSLFIGFPTFLMGGTIPVLTDALTADYDEGHRTHALIYGTNTAGAFLGALAAGFVLIERLGLPGTIVAASAISTCRSSWRPGGSPGPRAVPRPSSRPHPRPRRASSPGCAPRSGASRSCRASTSSAWRTC